MIGEHLGEFFEAGGVEVFDGVGDLAVDLLTTHEKQAVIGDLFFMLLAHYTELIPTSNPIRPQMAEGMAESSLTQFCVML